MEGVIGVVTCFAADFAPKNWALCNGQLLPINQNQALFSILGTTYGGNGINTFALPDLRSRTALSAGAGLGLPSYSLGQTAGTEGTTLTVNNLPPHNHNGNINLYVQGSNDDGTDPSPVTGYASRFTGAYSPAVTTGVTMTPPVYSNVVIGNAGNSVPLPIRSPYLGMNYVICLFGIFPSRN